MKGRDHDALVFSSTGSRRNLSAYRSTHVVRNRPAVIAKARPEALAPPALLVFTRRQIQLDALQQVPTMNGQLSQGFTVASISKLQTALNVLLLAVIAAGLIWKHDEDQKRTRELFANLRHFLRIEMDNWGDGLTPENGIVTPEDFLKIDFASPWALDQITDPDLVFFHPEGRFRAKPLHEAVLQLVADPDPPRLSFGKDARLIFNVRRHVIPPERIPKFPARQVTSLYVVIPLAVDCERADFPLHVPEDNHVIVDDPKQVIGCLATQDGKQSYYFGRLATRVKPLDEGTAP